MILVGSNEDPPFSHGLRIGVWLSLILAFGYAVLGGLVALGYQVWLLPGVPVNALPIARFAGMLPFGLLMALGPAVVLGTLTGGLIGELWEHIGRRVEGSVFALLGLALCALLVVGLHIVFKLKVDLTIPPVQLQPSEWMSDSLGLLVSYPFLLGLPSIVYILAGAWGSFVFWRSRQHERGQ